MKYFEFTNKFEYYALIAEETIGKAKRCYKENVCDIEDDSFPNEVNRDYVFDLLNSTVGEIDIEKEIELPGLILIDGNLL